MKRISDVIEAKLKTDLGAKSDVYGIKIGDVRVDVRKESVGWRSLEHTYKISVKTQYCTVRGSFFKSVTVGAEDIDKYMAESYPAVLEKVKAAVAKIQAVVDRQKEIDQRAEAARQDDDARRRQFIEEAQVADVLKQSNEYSDSGWASDSGRMQFKLFSDGTFRISNHYGSLTFDQVKAILAIIEGGKL